MLCFHGYGEDASSFAFLEKHLGSDYTLIAIDFPFHGKTRWNEGFLFTDHDLLAIIDQMMPLQLEKINILAYSMGARVALHLLQSIPDRMDKIGLVAPDGLHQNSWHWLATQTYIGNQLFRVTMQEPRLLFLLMQLFLKLHLMNKNIFNFAHYYLDRKVSRIELYERWTTMRKFIPAINRLKKTIRANQSHVQLLFGKYDRVIVTHRGLSFQKGIEKLVAVTEIHAGHQLLKEKYAPAITALFES